MINIADYPSKKRWLFSYYQNLPECDIKQEQIDALFELYKTCEYDYFINDIDYLLKYESINNGISRKIITGEQLNFNTRDIKHRNFVFNLKLKPGNNYVYYIYVYNSGDTIFVPISMYDKDFFSFINFRDLLIIGLFNGLTRASLIVSIASTPPPLGREGEGF